MPADDLRRHAANLVTGGRLALTFPFAWLVGTAEGGVAGWLAAALFALIAASDLVDGCLARRFAAASESGRLLDHVADISFILCALAAYVSRGVAPWWVPAAIAASFAVYVGDSWWQGGRVRPTLIGSRIGHTAGVLNYGLIGVLVGNESVGLHWLPAPVMHVLYLLVPLYSSAAIATRLLPVIWPKGHGGTIASGSGGRKAEGEKKG